jgi:hypothetical protein
MPRRPASTANGADAADHDPVGENVKVILAPFA